MGEIADLMINGDICAECGVTLKGAGDGFPRYCRSCTPPVDIAPTPKTKKVRCAVCARMVKPTGLADHVRDLHSGQTEARDA